MMNTPVYLDNHATTMVDPRVIDAVIPCFRDNYGNPASKSHPYGWKAREAVEVARQQIASLSGAEPGEVIFTSGATESVNMVLKGVARNRSWSEIHIVTCVTEHSCVLDTCAFLETLGAKITRLPVNPDGSLDLRKLDEALSSRPTLLSLMHANNEIGTIHPIAEISALCKQHGVLFHVDAAQSYGKIPINLRRDGIDFLSISAHKLYAPKGIGCLLIRRRIPPLRLQPLIHGGGHERGFRSGTLNVPGIVGLGKAAEICYAEMETEQKRVGDLRDQLLGIIKTSTPDAVINGGMDNRLPGNLNLSFPQIDGHLLLPALRNFISVSSGSACTSADPKPSHVLAALGQSDTLAQASLRFGIGRFNTEEEIQFAGEIVNDVVGKLRG